MATDVQHRVDFTAAPIPEFKIDIKMSTFLKNTNPLNKIQLWAIPIGIKSR